MRQIVVLIVAFAFSLVSVGVVGADEQAIDLNADVHALGVTFHGDTVAITPASPLRSIAATPDGGGYWLAAADGGVFAYGNAGFHGSLGDIALNQPIVGMAATPTGNGYWMVASDGGVFAFGDAGFFGSLGDLVLNEPIVGMAAHPSGDGYWLVASDGGVFAFGASAFMGSMGAIALKEPVVGMAAHPSGSGYWLVASDGGIFAFGAPFLGSTGAMTLDQPVVDMAATPSGNGYWMAAADGGIFSFGDAGFHGSAATTQRTEPVVGMAAAPDGSGYWMVRAAGPAWPLTGLPTASIDPRPALAVKIDNHSAARGQWGVNQADIVFEEMVEGGITRFVAVFHSTDPGLVGPIRSARETDLGLLPMLGDSLLAFSGGNRYVRSIVAEAPQVQGIWPDNAHNSAYFRTFRRADPHDLLARSATFWSFAEPTRSAPSPVFRYRPEVLATAQGVDAAPVTLEFGAQNVSWHWEAGRYVRSHSGSAHLDSDLARVSASNVVILETPYNLSGATGSPVADAVGSGRGLAMIDGFTLNITWSRGSVGETFDLRDGDGSPLLLAPGRTWVGLVPSGQAPFR